MVQSSWPGSWDFVLPLMFQSRASCHPFSRLIQSGRRVTHHSCSAPYVPVQGIRVEPGRRCFISFVLFLAFCARPLLLLFLLRRLLLSALLAPLLYSTLFLSLCPAYSWPSGSSAFSLPCGRFCLPLLAIFLLAPSVHSRLSLFLCLCSPVVVVLLEFALMLLSPMYALCYVSVHAHKLLSSLCALGHVMAHAHTCSSFFLLCAFVALFVCAPFPVFPTFCVYPLTFCFLQHAPKLLSPTPALCYVSEHAPKLVRFSFVRTLSLLCLAFLLLLSFCFLASLVRTLPCFGAQIQASSMYACTLLPFVSRTLPLLPLVFAFPLVFRFLLSYLCHLCMHFAVFWCTHISFWHLRTHFAMLWDMHPSLSFSPLWFVPSRSRHQCMYFALLWGMHTSLYYLCMHVATIGGHALNPFCLCALCFPLTL